MEIKLAIGHALMAILNQTWVVYIVTAGVALWAFVAITDHTHWYLGVPAAILAWLVTQLILGAVYGILKGLVEKIFWGW